MISSLLESQRLERIFKDCTTVQSFKNKLGMVLTRMITKLDSKETERPLNWIAIKLNVHDTGRARNWAITRLKGQETGRSRNWTVTKLNDHETRRSRNLTMLKLDSQKTGRPRDWRGMKLDRPSSNIRPVQLWLGKNQPAEISVK